MGFFSSALKMLLCYLITSVVSDKSAILCFSFSWAVFMIFFLFYNFIFNWRIIALQYFVGFCQTSAWIGCRCTHVPSLMPCRPSCLWVVTEPQFEFTASYVKFPLAVYLTHGDVCFHSTLSTHPTLSVRPHIRVCKRVLLRLCLLCCPQTGSSALFLESVHVCISTWCLFFSFWLTSLFVVGSRFIHLELTRMCVPFYSWRFFIIGFECFHKGVPWCPFLHVSCPWANESFLDLQVFLHFLLSNIWILPQHFWLFHV